MFNNTLLSAGAILVGGVAVSGTVMMVISVKRGLKRFGEQLAEKIVDRALNPQNNKPA